MQQKQITFAERLRSGELLIGTLISLHSPEVTEILASSGFDWLFIDAEHGAFNPQQVQGMLQAAGQCPCVIRVPSGEEIWIKKALDVGADGIIVPQVHTPEQVKKIISYCKYPPQGTRGVGIGRAHRYGLGFDDYIRDANQQTAIIIQAESRQAIDNIDYIVALEGIDAILIGPYDLSASFGKIGQVTDEEVVTAITTVEIACKKAQMQLGFFGVNAAAVNPYIRKGFTLITVGMDSLFLNKSAADILAEIRG